MRITAFLLQINNGNDIIILLLHKKSMSYLDQCHARRDVLRAEAEQDEARGVRRKGPVITPGLEVKDFGPFEMGRDDLCPKGTFRAWVRTFTVEERRAAIDNLLRQCGVTLDK